MEKILTLEEAQALIGHVFVYQMPFNQLIGLELIRFEQDYAEIQFRYQDKLVGNIAQRILHGGMIASVLDVSAGLVCVGNALTRLAPISKSNSNKNWPKWALSIYVLIIYAQGEGNVLPQVVIYYVVVIKFLWQGLNYTMKNKFISPAAQQLILLADATYPLSWVD